MSIFVRLPNRDEQKPLCTVDGQQKSEYGARDVAPSPSPRGPETASALFGTAQIKDAVWEDHYALRPWRSITPPPPRGPLRTSSCDEVNKYQPTPQCHPAFCHAFCGSGRMRHCPSQPRRTSTGSSEMIAVCLTHVQPEPGTGR